MEVTTAQIAGREALDWLLDHDVDLDAEGAVVADGADVVFHVGEVEVEHGGAALQGVRVGVHRRAGVVLPPPHLHHVIHPHVEPEHCTHASFLVREQTPTALASSL